LLVYLDAVMILNFLVDYLLILGTNRLTGFPPEYRKAAVSALLGGSYAGACMLPELHFLGNLFWRAVFLVLMAVTAFGWNRSALHRGAVFVLLSMALGGIAAGVGMVDFGAVCLCAVLIWLLCRVGVPGQLANREYIPVELHWKGRSLTLVALKDTGNTLRDPLTGEQVLVCGADVGQALFGIPEQTFSDPAGTLMTGILPGMRLIPYCSVGNEGGLLPALRLKNVKIGRKVCDPLVAFAPNKIGEGEVYQMLTGGMGT